MFLCNIHVHEHGYIIMIVLEGLVYFLEHCYIFSGACDIDVVIITCVNCGNCIAMSERVDCDTG